MECSRNVYTHTIVISDKTISNVTPKLILTKMIRNRYKKEFFFLLLHLSHLSHITVWLKPFYVIVNMKKFVHNDHCVTRVNFPNLFGNNKRRFVNIFWIPRNLFSSLSVTIEWVICVILHLDWSKYVFMFRGRNYFEFSIAYMKSSLSIYFKRLILRIFACCSLPNIFT